MDSEEAPTRCKLCGKETQHPFAGQYCGNCWYTLSLDEREEALTGKMGYFIVVLVLALIIAMVAAVFL